MRALQRRCLFVSGMCLAAIFLAQACKKKDDARPTPLDPPSLEFIGAENSAGQDFDLDASEVVLRCDGLLILHLGPEGENPGTIANWSLRPKGVCTNLRQCGYVLVEVLSEGGDVLTSASQAVASPLVDLSDVDVTLAKEFRATLIDGNTSEPFLVDEAAVVATFGTHVSIDCQGMGGAGGGDPNPSGGQGNVGGDGGAGGATGE